MWQCECIATWGRSTPRQSFFALYQGRSRTIYPFSTYNVFAADILYYAVTLTFDPLTLNVCSVLDVTRSHLAQQRVVDFWVSIIAYYCWRLQTHNAPTYKILAKSKSKAEL